MSMGILMELADVIGLYVVFRIRWVCIFLALLSERMVYGATATF